MSLRLATLAKIKMAGDFKDFEIDVIHNKSKDFSKVSCISTDAILQVIYLKLCTGEWGREIVLDFEIVKLHINNQINLNRLGLI